MIADYYFTSSLLLALACLAVALLRNPAKRVAVIRAVFVSVLLLPLLLFVPGRQWISCDVLTPPEQITIPAPRYLLRQVETVREAANSISETTPSHETSTQETPIAPSSFVSINLVSWGDLILSTQVLGMLAVGFWQLLGFSRTRRLLRETMPVEGSYATRCRVRIHPTLAAPLIVGIVRPTILLPKTDDEKEIRFAIAHENAHWLNGDLYDLAMERLLMFPLLFHPLFWLLRRTMRRDREMLADLRAVEQCDRLGYTEQLLIWARRTINRPLPGGVLVLGIVEDNVDSTPSPRFRNPFPQPVFKEDYHVAR